MDSQNIERRDSKKSTKGGTGSVGGGGNKAGQGRGGGGGIGNGNGGGSGKPSGEKQRSHSQKAGAGKPYREIYKPPSLRTSKSRSSNSYSEQQDKGRYNDEKANSPPAANQSNSRKGAMSNSNFSRGNNGGGGGNNGNQRESPPNHQQNGLYNGDGDSSNGYSLFGNGGRNENGSNGNGNGPNSSSVPSSPLISNRMQQQQQQNAAFQIGLAKRMLNVNAKEFQFQNALQQQQHQQQQQQISNFLSQLDPSLFYNGNSSLLGNAAGYYPLKQSKSSGNMNLHLQQQQQQQQQQAQQGGNFSNAMNNNNGVNGQFNRLSHSKSSGNVPGNGNKPRVRFDDEEPDFEDVDEFVGGQLGNYLASLKLNGDLGGMPAGPHFQRGYPFQQQPQPTVPLSPQPVLKSSLQKSRTGFYLNLYGNQQQQQQPSQTSPTKSPYGFNNNSMGGGGIGLNLNPNYVTQMTPPSPNLQRAPFQGSSSSSSSNINIVKRSRSFGPGIHHLPRVSATTLLSSSGSGSISSGYSIYSDFCIARWPRAVQELVTAAVTGVDRIPARNWIEMVNGIFEAMLCDFRPTKQDRIFSAPKSASTTIGEAASVKVDTEKSAVEMSAAAGESSEKNHINGVSSSTGACADMTNDLGLDEEEGEDDEDDTDLTSAAVHIFLYFIQREKDRTVMESLLNTCFASFQRLSTLSISSSSSAPTSKSQQRKLLAEQIGKPSISRQWSNFLRFLSTLYSQVKLIRRQKQSQQQPGQSMDEMSFSLLALLCDSCLATLRSPQSYTAEMVGCLFTVLTSIGRDMEGTFPLKMKQLLAAVRDALLGLGPYHQQQQQHQNSNLASSSGLSPIVQKTLMQLIELHAANWQLPASAVRYYYSSVGGGGGGGGGSSKSTASSTNMNSGNASNRSPKKANNVNSSSNDKHENNGTIPTSLSESSPNNKNSDEKIGGGSASLKHPLCDDVKATEKELNPTGKLSSTSGEESGSGTPAAP